MVLLGETKQVPNQELKRRDKVIQRDTNEHNHLSCTLIRLQLVSGCTLATESQAGFQPSPAPLSFIQQTGVTSALQSLGSEHLLSLGQHNQLLNKTTCSCPCRFITSLADQGSHGRNLWNFREKILGYFEGGCNLMMAKDCSLSESLIGIYWKHWLCKSIEALERCKEHGSVLETS